MIKHPILIVDDMNPILKVFKFGMPDDYDVVVANNIYQAKTFCMAIRFDIVLTDIHLLPHTPFGGFELVQSLVNMKFSGKIGIMSGYAQDIPIHLIDHIDFILEKPFSIPDFLETIQGVNK